jgi:hypothetical protein
MRWKIAKTRNRIRSETGSRGSAAAPVLGLPEARICKIRAGGGTPGQTIPEKFSYQGAEHDTAPDFTLKNRQLVNCARKALKILSR